MSKNIISLSTPSHPPLSIVPAQREDMDLVAGFVRSSADWYRDIVDTRDMAEHDVDDDWAETNFRRRDFYLGHADDTAVGTISLQYFGDYAYLGYIYLDVRHVGKGYGHTLMRFAEETSRRRGMKGMALIAHPRAQWAKKAYLKFGFEIAERKKNEVLAWNGGALQPYYEQGFELYLYRLGRKAISRSVERSTEATSHAS
jgi:GNAT superfamily N-acetyltransferase